jgi:DNA-binding protein YbaB
MEEKHLFEMIGRLYMQASLMQENMKNMAAKIKELESKGADLEKLLEIHSKPPQIENGRE